MIARCSINYYSNIRHPCSAFYDTEDAESRFGWFTVHWADEHGDGVALLEFDKIECLQAFIDIVQEMRSM